MVRGFDDSGSPRYQWTARWKAQVQQSFPHVQNAWNIAPPRYVRWSPWGKRTFEYATLVAQNCSGKNYYEAIVANTKSPRGWNRQLFERRVREVLTTFLMWHGTIQVRKLNIASFYGALFFAAPPLIAWTASIARPVAEPKLWVSWTFLLLMNMGQSVYAIAFNKDLGSSKVIMRVIAVAGLAAYLALVMGYLGSGLLGGLAVGLFFLTVSHFLAIGIREVNSRRDRGWLDTNLTASVVASLADVYHVTELHREDWPSVESTEKAKGCIDTISYEVTHHLPRHLAGPDSRVFEELAAGVSAHYTAWTKQIASGTGRKFLSSACIREIPLVIGGFWTELSGEGVKGIPAATSKISGGIVWRRLAVAGIPLVATLIIRQFGLLDLAYASPLVAIGILWMAVVAILSLEPEANRYAELIVNVWTAVKSSPTPGKEGISKGE